MYTYRSERLDEIDIVEELFDNVCIRGVKKNQGIITGTGKPGNRKPGSRFRFRFGKTKNRVPRFRYPVFGIRFLPS
jgi:hypothetical protein